MFDKKRTVLFLIKSFQIFFFRVSFFLFNSCENKSTENFQGLGLSLIFSHPLRCRSKQTCSAGGPPPPSPSSAMSATRAKLLQISRVFQTFWRSRRNSMDIWKEKSDTVYRMSISQKSVWNSLIKQPICLLGLGWAGWSWAFSGSRFSCDTRLLGRFRVSFSCSKSILF